MSYGIKISKTGEDVLTATIDNLQLSSEYPTARVVVQGELSLDTSPYHDPDATEFVGYTFVIPHGLGYIPSFWVYGINNDVDNTLIRTPYPAHGEIGASTQADATNVYINLYMAPWSMVTNLWKGYYYIIANSL